LINEKEIGGKDKSRKQIEGIENSLSPQTILSMVRTKYHYGCLDFVLIDGVLRVKKLFKSLKFKVVCWIGT
jgi:hypothetical protein